MASDTRQGRADHRAVELFERCAQVATELTDDPMAIFGLVPEVAEEIYLDAAIRFWDRRGYREGHFCDHADPVACNFGRLPGLYAVETYCDCPCHADATKSIRLDRFSD